jgi:hypothetical protein
VSESEGGHINPLFLTDGRHFMDTAGGTRSTAAIYIGDLEILREYVGTYEGGRGALVVTLEDGRLMIGLNGAGEIPLFAHSETAFTMEGTGIRFERDARGVVTRLVQSWTEGDRVFVRKTK